MVYTKTNWSTGMIIDADKLNNIETGIKTTNDAIITGGTLFTNENGAPTSLVLEKEDGTQITIAVRPPDSSPEVEKTKTASKATKTTKSTTK